MEKMISKKYGVQNEEQAKALVDTLLNNAAEQIVASEYISTEYNLDHANIMEHFKYILLEKSANALIENLIEHMKKFEEGSNEGEYK